MKVIKSVQFIGRPPMIFDQAITGYLHTTSTGIVSITLTEDERRVIIRTKRDVVVVPSAGCYITFDDYPGVPRETSAPSDHSEPAKAPTPREAAARARWKRVRAEHEMVLDE
jgi:hypothetical protein